MSAVDRLVEGSILLARYQVRGIRAEIPVREPMVASDVAAYVGGSIAGGMPNSLDRFMGVLARTKGVDALGINAHVLKDHRVPDSLGLVIHTPTSSESIDSGFMGTVTEVVSQAHAREFPRSLEPLVTLSFANSQGVDFQARYVVRTHAMPGFEVLDQGKEMRAFVVFLRTGTSYGL